MSDQEQPARPRRIIRDPQFLAEARALNAWLHALADKYDALAQRPDPRLADRQATGLTLAEYAGVGEGEKGRAA